MQEIFLLNTKDYDHFFLQEVIQYQMMNLVLILTWSDQVQNQRETLMDDPTLPMNLSLLSLILHQISLQRRLQLQILLR